MEEKKCAKNGCEKQCEPYTIYCKDHLEKEQKVVIYKLQNARPKSEERENKKSS
jgi:hypothetical protein